MSAPEGVEGPASEGERLSEAWAAEPSVEKELQKGREQNAPKSPTRALLGEVVEKLGEYANIVTDQRNEAIAERDVDSVAHWADRVAGDYEAEPEEVALAASELLDTVGHEDYRFTSFLDSWQESDPDAANEWLTERQWQNYYEVQNAIEEGQAVEAQQAADHAAAMVRMAEQFAEDHPDALRYRDLMVRLAQQSGIDLAGPPEHVRVALDALHEGARQFDPDAEPIRGANRSGWDVSLGWEQAQADAVLNAGPSLRGRSESVAAFQERMNERHFDVDVEGGIHSQMYGSEIEARTSTRSAPGARVTPEEFSKQEGARLAEAWNLPTVHGERHGERDAKGRFAAAEKAAEAARPGGRDDAPDDPGGFWAYTLHGRFG